MVHATRLSCVTQISFLSPFYVQLCQQQEGAMALFFNEAFSAGLAGTSLIDYTAKLRLILICPRELYTAGYTVYKEYILWACGLI